MLNKIAGYYFFFEATVTAAQYRKEILALFINQMVNEEVLTAYFQQDDATAHTTRKSEIF